MGRKIKVIELANKLIRAYGKVPGKDIEITFVGKRPGEKIEEELISKHEIAKKTKVKRLLKICQKTEEKLITPAKINALIKYAAENDNDELIKKRIFDLI